MNSQDKKIKQQKVIAKLPDSPGVYFFTRRAVTSARLGFRADPKSSRLQDDPARKILYIGKATSLRDRVRSYFSKDVAVTRGPKIVKMLTEFSDIQFQKTDSVLEAIILEANLIKKYQPIYNTIQKDNKSWNFVVITKEKFPRVLLMRGRDLEMSRVSLDTKSRMSRLTLDMKVARQFGPFTNGGQLKEAMKIIRSIFPWRDDKCVPCEEQLKMKSKVRPSGSDYTRSNLVCRACFNKQIRLCPGVCTGEITADEYKKTIKNISEFFSGNKKGVVKNLKKQMNDFSKKREFEKALEIKKRIFALNHIRDVSLIKQENIIENGESSFRLEAYDIAHFAGKDVVGVMTVVEDGQAKLSDYRKFKIKNNPGVNDTKALSEILERRLAHIEWPLPKLLVVDGGVAQKNVMEKVLDQNGVQIPVVSVVKNEHHRPERILGDKRWLSREADILLANAESHRFAIGYHRKIRRSR